MAETGRVLTGERAEYLQDKLTEETGGDGFSKLPFRYAEIAKILLDMCVIPLPIPTN